MKLLHIFCSQLVPHTDKVYSGDKVVVCTYLFCVWLGDAPNPTRVHYTLTHTLTTPVVVTAGSYVLMAAKPPKMSTTLKPSALRIEEAIPDR